MMSTVVVKAAVPMTPQQRDQKSLERAKSQKRQAQFGLANNAFGAAAGTIATAQAYRSAPKDIETLRESKIGQRAIKLKRGKVGQQVARIPGARKVGRLVRRLPPKAVVGTAGAGLVGMQLANAGMDAQSGAYFANQSRVTAKKQKNVERRIERRAAKGTPVVAKSYEQVYDAVVLTKSWDGVGRNLLLEDVSKRARRVDPEGDRQRRLGMYEGLGTAGALGLTGASGALGWNAWKKASETNKTALGRIALKARVPAGLAAGAGASTLLGVAAHRRANSVRNQRWT